MNGINAADPSAYSGEIRAFHKFWYAHMSEDKMQPPLSGVSYAQALYIWNASKYSPQYVAAKAKAGDEET